MTPLFVTSKPMTVKEDLDFLNKQIEVGTLLVANPAILEYLEYQIDLLVCELVGINQDPHGDSVRLKDAVLFRTQQIAAYRHLHDLASKLPENNAVYTKLRTQL
jgi:hypothetical protein